MMLSAGAGADSSSFAAANQHSTPTRRPPPQRLSARPPAARPLPQPQVKHARLDVDATGAVGAAAVAAAASPRPTSAAAMAAAASPRPTVAVAMPLPPPPLAPAAASPLPDPALQRAVNACASWRDCAALLAGPHAPRLDAMLVCALATRAARLASSFDEAEDDDTGAATVTASPPPAPTSFAAFVALLASAALERAPSSRPQQFAQVAVSLARLATGPVGQGQADAARRRARESQGDSSSGAAEDEARLLPAQLRPWLERYLAAAEVHLPGFSERRLCQLTWAAAKLWTVEEQEQAPQQPPPLPPPPQPLPAGERWWGALLSEAQDRLPTLRDGRDWSNLMWALARLGVAVPPGWADDALAALTRGGCGGHNGGNGGSSGGASSSSFSSPILATMRPRERATVLWALARMGVAPPPGWVERELAPALLCRPSPDERRAEREARAERRERPWARRERLAEVQEEEEDEPESARDVAVTLWALARWHEQQQQQAPPGPAAANAAAAALAARAADALDRELPPASASNSAAAAASSHSLVVALASLARLPGALRQGGGVADQDQQQQQQQQQQQLWLSLARRAVPSLSGRGIARLVRGVGALRLRRPPAPEWMRALQMRALQLASSARLRAGELAAVLRFFAAVAWVPGAAWWAALLSAAEATGLVRAAPPREALALAGAVRMALRVVDKGRLNRLGSVAKRWARALVARGACEEAAVLARATPASVA